jgi:hypothetical protein
MRKIITNYLRFMESAAEGDKVWYDGLQLQDSTGIVPFPISDFPTDYPGASWRAQKTITVYTGSPHVITQFDPGGSTQNIWVAKSKIKAGQYCFPGGSRGGGAEFGFDTDQPGYVYELVIDDPLYLDRPGGHGGGHGISSNYPSHLKWYNTNYRQKNYMREAAAAICGGKVREVNVTKLVPYNVEGTVVSGLQFNVADFLVAPPDVEFDVAVKLGLLLDKDREEIQSDDRLSEVALSFLHPLIRGREVSGNLVIRTVRIEGRENQPLITAKDVEDHVKIIDDAIEDMKKRSSNLAASEEAFKERIKKFLREVNGRDYEKEIIVK